MYHRAVFALLCAVSAALLFFLPPQLMAESSTLRVATFNVSMEATNYPDDSAPNQHTLARQLKVAGNVQINGIAEQIQRLRPDVVLLNEFDECASPEQCIEDFQTHYLGRSQNDQEPIRYDYAYVAPVNTGVLSGVDLNGDGQVSLPEDAYGWGRFPGHYGMVLLSQYPIDTARVRTFQTFLWKDMPDAQVPRLADGRPYYSEDAWQRFRLSSKSHWDVPIDVDGTRVHFLASHPTPPVFDGDEDRNGLRNHDEIRLWADYINNASYLYDDSGRKGGLAEGARFVILGDLNASDCGGAAHPEAIKQLLTHPSVQDPKPRSDAAAQKWADKPCAERSTHDMGLRLDYVLPSRDGLEVVDTGVFWPTSTDDLAYLVAERKTGSDHRLVWVDLRITDE